MTLRRTSLYLLLVWAVIFLCVGVWWYMELQRVAEDGTRSSLRVGLSGPAAAELSAYVFYALDNGLFAKRGLDVTLVEKSSGVESLKALEADEVDVAFASEFAVVNRFAQGYPSRIMGAVAQEDSIRLLAYADSEIVTADDFVGKRIAFPAGTRAEFALHVYLEQRGVSSDDVVLVPVSVSEVQDMFVRREVDAIAFWNPVVDQIIGELGGDDEVRIFDLDSLGLIYWIMVTHPRVIDAQPQALDAFVASLVDVQRVLPRNEDVFAYVIERGFVDQDYVDRVFQKMTVFGVSLSPDLIIAMQREIDWLQMRGVDLSREIVLSLMYEQPLLFANPDAVTAY